MAIKSVLVHLAEDDDLEARLRTAHDVARAQGARLTGLHVTELPTMPPGAKGRAASAGYLAEMADAAAAHLREFERVMEAFGPLDDVGFTWRHETGPLLRVLARQTLVHDLAVVSQSPPRTVEALLFAERPDHLAVMAACPVLILPHGFSPRPIGERVLVAWKPERECALAMRGALPFLARAADVRVISIDGTGLSETEAVAYLACHDVRARADALVTREETVEDILFAYGEGMNADLLVLGGFGHSRLWELVLGSTTRRLLSESRTPLLMAH